MKRVFQLLAASGVLLLALGVGFGLWTLRWADQAGPLTHPAVIILEKGRSSQQIAGILAEAGVIDQPALFAVLARLTRFDGDLQSGEYAVPAAITPNDLLALLRSGRRVVHRLVIPEGLTVAEILAQIGKAEALTGDLPSSPPEGSLMPDTYFYSWGDHRDALVDRMRQAMTRTLAGLWALRQPGLPLTDPAAAVILASIVEKETGLDAERPVIAAVFYNRLRLGMRLQSDPTVIYGLTHGLHPLDRPLTHHDLETVDPYNTYVINGLPPGPIANPGRAALKAVLQPAHSNALYFVADGSGGHAFADTLEAHNHNVAHWRQLQH